MEGAPSILAIIPGMTPIILFVWMTIYLQNAIIHRDPPQLECLVFTAIAAYELDSLSHPNWYKVDLMCDAKQLPNGNVLPFGDFHSGALIHSPHITRLTYPQAIIIDPCNGILISKYGLDYLGCVMPRANFTPAPNSATPFCTLLMGEATLYLTTFSLMGMMCWSTISLSAIKPSKVMFLLIYGLCASWALMAVIETRPFMARLPYCFVWSGTAK